MADLYTTNANQSQNTNNPGLTAPASRAILVTPSDTKDVTNATGDAAASYAKSLYIGTTGNVAIVAANDNSASGAGTAVTFSNVPVGWFPVRVRRVMSTNTTASNIVGLYDI